MIFLFLVCIVTLSFIIILFPRLLVSLSTKALFICYFVFYCKQLVNLSTRLLVNFKLVKTKKTLAGSQGFSGAYETRTRDLLRDRQAF